MDISKSFDLPEDWNTLLSDELCKPYMMELKDFLCHEEKLGKTIYPLNKKFFHAFDLVSPDNVRVVILGQDPYHGPGQAHGLSFSVPDGIPIPPSLRNIYKEIHRDFGFTCRQNGNLESWAKQGVLLLNSVLSVEASKAGSHAGKGWEIFTDTAIQVISKQCQPAVFMLWGAYAQKKASYIDGQKHLILKAPHPSPLSAHRGFIECGHFSKANHFLKQHDRGEINWETLIKS